MGKYELKKKQVAMVRWNNLPMTVAEFLKELNSDEKLKQQAIEIWGKDTVDRLMSNKLPSRTITLIFEQATMFGE